jgi:hypothetical protein
MTICLFAGISVSNHGVEGVSSGGAACFYAGSHDVTLRRGHRFVAEQFHQGADADVRTGEFGRVGVAEDLMIAATALSLGVVLVTRNPADVEQSRSRTADPLARAPLISLERSSLPIC